MLVYAPENVPIMIQIRSNRAKQPFNLKKAPPIKAYRTIHVNIILIANKIEKVMI